MRRHQPLHPPTQVAIPVRPQHQVKVIRHQAEPGHSQRQPLTRLTNQIQKRLIVFSLVKDLRPLIASIDSVIAIPTHRSPRSPRHNNLHQKNGSHVRGIENQSNPASLQVFKQRARTASLRTYSVGACPFMWRQATSPLPITSVHGTQTQPSPHIHRIGDRHTAVSVNWNTASNSRH